MTPEEVELLSELTIVIPTYNRPLELERAIECLRDLPLTVHIIDGAIKPCFSVGQLVFGTAKIYYHSIPIESNEKPMENYARRLIKGMSLIKTKFAAQLADDDFFNFRGLCKALEILITDERIDAVIGKCAIYNFDQQKIVWKKKWLNWVPNELLRDDLLSVRIKGDAGKNIVYYGVLRSEKLRAIHNRANRFVFSDFRKNELLAHHLGLAYCRTVLIKEYLWSRQNSLKKNQNYNYLIRPSDSNENLLLKEVFFDAFGDIDPSVSADLKSDWSSRKVQLIEERLKADDAKYSGVVDIGRIAKLESVTKSFLMKFFLAIPRTFQIVLYSIMTRRFKTTVDAELPPEFEGKNDLEKLLTMPREELRLRANL